VKEIRGRHPGAAILVLFGESHLAPGHLPRELKERCPERTLTVLQNVDALTGERGGRHDRWEAVQVATTSCACSRDPVENTRITRVPGPMEAGRFRRADMAPTVYT